MDNIEKPNEVLSIDDKILIDSWETAEQEMNDSLAGDADWASYQEALRECQEFSLDRLVVTS